jgi:small redox-active disulfide protein 2
MQIKLIVYGMGCSKCKLLEQNCTKAINDLKLKASVEKVTDLSKICDAGVLITPALAIDGKIVSSGKVLSADEIKRHLK